MVGGSPALPRLQWQCRSLDGRGGHQKNLFVGEESQKKSLLTKLNWTELTSKARMRLEPQDSRGSGAVAGGEGGSACVSPVVVGFVGERGGGGYGIGGALDLDVYIYIYIYIFIYIYLHIVFENINFIPGLGNFLVFTSSLVSCICLCVYILTRKRGGQLKFQNESRTEHRVLIPRIVQNNRSKIAKHTLWHVSVSPKIMPHNTCLLQPCGVSLFIPRPALNTLSYFDTLAKCHVLAYQTDLLFGFLSLCVLLCFIKPILGSRYVRSRGFNVSEQSKTHPWSEIANVPTSPWPPLDNLGCPDTHPQP